MSPAKYTDIKINNRNTRTDVFYTIFDSVHLSGCLVNFIMERTIDYKKITTSAEIINVDAKKLKVTFLASNLTNQELGVYKGQFEIIDSKGIKTYFPNDQYLEVTVTDEVLGDDGNIVIPGTNVTIDAGVSYTELTERFGNYDSNTVQPIKVNLETIKATIDSAKTLVETAKVVAEDSNTTANLSKLVADAAKTTADTAQAMANDNADKIKNLNKGKCTPFDFGAKANGTDDRKAIQDAIDYISSLPAGGTLEIPKGFVFTLKSFTNITDKIILNLKDKVSIIGEGILKIADRFGDYHSVFNVASDLNDVLLQNFNIDENTTNNPMTNTPSPQNLNYRITMFLWGRTFKNITIDNIKVTDCCGVWQITSGKVTNFNVRNCKIEYTSSVPSIEYDRTSIYFGGVGGTVSGNTLMGASYANTAIEIHGKNTAVTSNVIMNYNAGIFVVNDAEIIGSENFEGVIVANNVLQDVCTGIMVWLSSPNRVSNLKISNNVLNLTPTRLGKSNVLTGSGISFDPVWESVDISNIEITNNLVNSFYEGNKGITDVGTKYCGIFIPMYTDGLVYSLKNLIIKDNTIVNSINSGICLELGSGGAGSILNTLNISFNTIRNVGQIVPTNGIELIGITKFFSCSVEKNTIVDDRNVALLDSAVAYFSGGDTGDDSLTQLKISENETVVSDPNFKSKGVNGHVSLETPCYVKMKITGDSKQDPIDMVVKRGSIVEDVNSGRIYRQVQSPSGNKWISESYGTDAPTFGFYNVGDTIKNLNGDTLSNMTLGWVCYQQGYRSEHAWGASTSYKLGDRVHSWLNGAVYECITAGTSGTVQPSDVSDDLVDGTVHWKFLDWIALFSEMRSSSVKKSGTLVYNGDSKLTKTIPHDLGDVPSIFFVQAASVDAGASVIKYVTADANNLNVFFTTATKAGTNNIKLLWKAEI
ncbi:alanine-zipper protein [Bacillus sp. S13(2024)]|uniref:hypothetical protein n=1 Tax=Bacillus sp. S13(2024) TaxID=3162885 RepID=UPI003D22975E